MFLSDLSIAEKRTDGKNINTHYQRQIHTLVIKSAGNCVCQRLLPVVF